jgi:hypothetical protein
MTLIRITSEWFKDKDGRRVRGAIYLDGELCAVSPDTYETYQEAEAAASAQVQRVLGALRVAWPADEF